MKTLIPSLFPDDFLKDSELSCKSEEKCKQGGNYLQGNLARQRDSTDAAFGLAGKSQPQANRVIPSQRVEDQVHGTDGASCACKIAASERSLLHGFLFGEQVESGPSPAFLQRVLPGKTPRGICRV